MCGMGELLLIRHGETAWSRTGQYGGRTDLPLTDAGVAAGRALGPMLAGRRVAAAFSSPLSRAVRTAELAGLTDVKPDPDLLEWDYGDDEGSTEERIRALSTARTSTRRSRSRPSTRSPAAARWNCDPSARTEPSSSTTETQPADQVEPGSVRAKGS
jgi:broad specificity phosphatase PhoE